MLLSLYLQLLYSLDWRIAKPIDSRQHMETEDFKFPVVGGFSNNGELFH